MKTMKKDKFSVLFHDLLGNVSSIRNALHLLLMGKAGQLNEKTKPYLEEALKKCENLIEKINQLRRQIG